MEQAISWAEGVRDGKIIANRFIKLAVDRFFSDVENMDSLNLVFNYEKAEQAINLIQSLKHTKGPKARQLFLLEPWQKFIVINLFGWYFKTGRRRFKYLYNEVARKNGKTTFLAAIAWAFELLFDEAASEIYFVATKRDQARICFEEAQRMGNQMRQDYPDINQLVKVFQHSIVVESTNSKMQPLAADSNTLDGTNPFMVCNDEYHAAKNADVYNVMKSGMGARTGNTPMLATITTAGFNIEGPCYNLRKTAIEIIEGKKQDESFFVMIFTLDEGDDWEDPENWIKSNPNMGVSISKEFLLTEYTQCQNLPSEQTNFITKNLNIWTSSSTSWIKDSDWMKCNKHTIKLEDFKNRECYAGLDLASTSDITALSLLFPFEHKGRTYFDSLFYFFIPEDSVVARTKQGVNYAQWVKEGHIITTPGNIADYDYIENKIYEIAEIVDLKKLGVDQWNAMQLVPKLVINGIKAEFYNQNIAHMGPPTKEFEKLIMSKRINHGGNPVMRWMMGNIEIYRDANDNLKINKSKSAEKVDGPVALVIAIGQQMSSSQSAPLPSIDIF